MPYISYMPIRTIQTIQAIHAYTIKYISLHTNSYNTYHTYQYIPYIQIHTYTYQYIQYIPYIPIHAIRTDTCQYLPIPALMNTYRYMPYVPIHTNTCNTYHCQYVHQYVPSWYIPIRTKIHAKIHTHTYQYMFTDSIRANTSIANPCWGLRIYIILWFQSDNCGVLNVLIWQDLSKSVLWLLETSACYVQGSAWWVTLHHGI